MNVNLLDLLFENDFLAIFPEIFLLNAIFILLFFGFFYSGLAAAKPYDPISDNSGIKSETIATTKDSPSPLHFNEPSILKNVGWLSLWVLSLTLFLLYNNPIVQSIIFYNNLILDDFTYFFKFFLKIFNI